MAIKHGGNLFEIAKRYKSNVNQWIDLSTGVSPFTYPISAIPTSVWNQLPQENDGLELAAQHYYESHAEPAIVAGSQAAIMLLPKVVTQQLGYCGVIALPSVGYKEHQHAWENFSQDGKMWQVEYYEVLPTAELVAKCDVVLIINPNNPTGKLNSKRELQALLGLFKSSEGLLIIDEAFADCTPEVSLLEPNKTNENLIILRSIGKFFGLAGARVGFIFANQKIQQAISQLIGPWTVTGPSRYIVKKALQDVAWQAENRALLKQQSTRLALLIEKIIPNKISFTDLFVTLYLDDPIFCHDFL